MQDAFGGVIANGAASVSASSVSTSSAARRRSRAEFESSPGRCDSIILPAETGKLGPLDDRRSNERREEYSGHVPVSSRAQVSVNQTTIAMCGFDSSMALLDAHVCGIFGGTSTRS